MPVLSENTISVHVRLLPAGINEKPCAMYDGSTVQQGLAGSSLQQGLGAPSLPEARD